ncbi:MAG: hypothetical protein AAGL17_18665, partial [Cyanobacteria bacterium J06576_12]
IGAEQLELTAAAVARLDEQVERKAQRLSRSRPLPEQTNIGGVAEAVLKDIDPELLERVRDRIAKDKAPSSNCRLSARSGHSSIRRRDSESVAETKCHKGYFVS